MLMQQRVARLDNAEHHRHEERRDQREFDDALAFFGFEFQLNLGSFFIADSTWSTTCPPGKNGRMSGVMTSHA